VRGVSFRHTLPTLPVSPALASPSVSLLALLFAQAPGGPVDGPAVPVRPHIRAVRTTQRPVIDGRLDDPAWRSAVPSDTFTQHFPSEGAPPSERTEVRILYDDDALYVGVDCWQVHVPVVKRLMRRDTQLSSDGVWMDIDSRRDGATAFHFGVNAAGVLSDAIHFNDTDYSSDWDAVWEGKAADTDHGYSIEFRIPLYVLKFTALPVQDWGFQLRRFVEAQGETDDWAFFSRRAGSYIPTFGRLDDLTELRPRRALQLRPFGLGRLRHRAAAAAASSGTLARGFDATASAGLDAKAAVSNELTLDLALNPDFGQVEADAVILNLSTFETFFPEKRPFFLEGIDAFAGIRPLLYTRRIGRQAASPALAAGETLVDAPEPSPIYGAAKLVGTIGGRTTIGLLSAVTGETNVDVQVTDPVAGPRLVRRLTDPLSAFNVMRLKRLVGADAEVGVLATATNRFDRGFNDAYVASADGRWRSPWGDYAASGQAIASALVGGPPRAARDGIPVRPGTLAGGGSLIFGKQGGPHWLWSATQNLAGRQLEFNDLGYLERKNDYQGLSSVTYRTIEPWWKTIETRTTLQGEVRRTLDGVDLANAAQLSTWWLLANFWTISAAVQFRGASHDDREMGDGTALQRAARWGGELSIYTDSRRRVSGSIFGQALRLSNGTHLEARGQVTLRLLPQLELDVLPTATFDEGEPRYVSTTSADPTLGSTYLLGTQQARSLGATVRAAYTFTPELSLQVYSQAFLARVHYAAFFQTPAVGFRQRVDLSALVPTAPPAASPDSLTATLNVNVVLRWEYRLGSTLFLVYTRAQAPALAVPPGGATSLDLQPVLRGRAAVDVIMLKLAYWWG
jgi:Domain of unknown function (DUF5916)/Carbohydrate family 9 binding domain-like